MKIDCPKCQGNGYLPPSYPTPDAHLTLLCDECLGAGTIEVEDDFWARFCNFLKRFK